MSIPRECYDRRPHREPWVNIQLPRNVLRKCLIDALEENEVAQTYFTDAMVKIRAACRVYKPRRKL